MATLTVTLPTGATVVNGKQVTFRAPCDCTGISGIVIDGTTYTLVDATTEQITGHTFKKDAMVSVIMDTENNKAFVQNGIIFGVSTVELSKEEYDALVASGAIDPNTIYVVTDDVAGIGIEFVITAPASSVITATCDGATVNRVGSGKLNIPFYGTWTLKCASEGQTITKTVIADTAKQYNFNFKFYAANFADNTWEQIIEACQLDVVPDNWKIGDSKAMSIGNSYVIDIIGKHHDTYQDGGTAPITFQMHSAYQSHNGMASSSSNAGGWEDCSMRVTTFSFIRDNFPEEVKSALKKVVKTTGTGTSSVTYETTYDDIFLLSEIECFGATTNSHNGEGTQYEYYKVGNSKIKDWYGDTYAWWLRSPSKSSTSNYCLVSTSGRATTAAYNNNYAIIFAFCL